MYSAFSTQGGGGFHASHPHFCSTWNISMEIRSILQQFGLNEKETSIYLACLELGTATVLQLSKKSAIKRPTCYLILDELIRRGLVSVVAKNNKTLYVAENPETIQNMLEERLRSIREAMPLLQALYHAEKQKPRVKMYEGRTAMMKVYEEEIYRSKEILFFGSIHHILQHFPDAIERFQKLALGRQIRSRELVSHYPEDYEYARKVGSSRNQIRFSPVGLSFKIDAALVRNKIFLFSVGQDHFVTVIESQNIYDSFLTLFEMAWLAGRPAADVLAEMNDKDGIVPRGTME